MRKLPIALKRTQRGATLIVALLILLMIMMYGIPAAMDSMQNERMAGNTRQRDLAFQATEHAIKKAQTWILTQTHSSLDALAPATVTICSPGNTDPNTTDCIFPNGQCHANDVVYWRSFFSSNSSNVCTLSGTDTIGLVTAQPRYIVERMPSDTSGSQKKDYYRVTAWGVGQDSNAVVIIQTMYQFAE
ncbi:MAG TPA: PilX N-terminal domain-containing pilus assembly protein [Candidatus Competibacteraceae bacterium]|nr:MAG: hypothetical protein EKK71_08680 [Candidatus Competibacteraceae bacterium]HQD55822.1 PilX N-terminal domain-containing pilus assembly protein [Candidatus Competibacteraceae bacterium]